MRSPLTLFCPAFEGDGVRDDTAVWWSGASSSSRRLLNLVMRFEMNFILEIGRGGIWNGWDPFQESRYVQRSGEQEEDAVENSSL